MLFPISKLKILDQDKSTFLFFLIFSIFFFFLIIIDITVDIKLAIVFIFLLIVFFYYELKKPIDEEISSTIVNNQPSYLLALKIIFSFLVLFFSSRYFIEFAKNLTELFGVAETTIGITVVAFGTSLPEVIATIISIVKKQSNIAIGNILGSNIANIFGITLIAVFLNSEINYFFLLTMIDKWLFLLTSLLFFTIIMLRLAGKILSIALILCYLTYFSYLYV